VSESDSLLRWYAIRTRSRHEKLVRDRLASQGIEILLPTVIRLSQWKDRKKQVEFPLFSGYCFARFPWMERTPILMVSGVVEIVGSGGRGESIPDREIGAIQALMASALPYDAHPYLREGMTVKVIRGPLEGVEGVLLRKAKRYRLVVSVHLIQQAAAVELDAADVMPLWPEGKTGGFIVDEP
jgi:transcription antitermination factor NusG